MSQNVPTAATEHVSVDNIPTGNVELLIHRHEMPDKFLVSRYWSGMEKPEQLAYVPERKCKNVAPSYLEFLCSECGFVYYRNDENFYGDNDWHFCPNCGKAVTS